VVTCLSSIDAVNLTAFDPVGGEPAWEVSAIDGLAGRALLEACKSDIDRGGVLHHPFLVRFENDLLDSVQLKLFAAQWYKTATAHREAFPALIANIKDDDLRFELIEILNEEYGNGNQTQIHARLLERWLRGIGLTVTEVDGVEPLTAIAAFSAGISEIWKNGAHPKAIGLHFGLEYLASAFQPHFSRGFAKYHFLTDSEREYFEVHAEAEIRHVAYSENGFLRYANHPSDRQKLVDGLRTGQRLLGAVWDQFNGLVFP
jgi:pyrroloquinoline quinone (PQQ) biosynthesis protein C